MRYLKLLCFCIVGMLVFMFGLVLFTDIGMGEVVLAQHYVSGTTDKSAFKALMDKTDREAEVKLSSEETDREMNLQGGMDEMISRTFYEIAKENGVCEGLKIDPLVYFAISKKEWNHLKSPKAPCALVPTDPASYDASTPEKIRQFGVVEIAKSDLLWDTFLGQNTQALGQFQMTFGHGTQGLNFGYSEKSLLTDAGLDERANNAKISDLTSGGDRFSPADAIKRTANNFMVNYRLLSKYAGDLMPKTNLELIVYMAQAHNTPAVMSEGPDFFNAFTKMYNREAYLFLKWVGSDKVVNAMHEYIKENLDEDGLPPTALGWDAFKKNVMPEIVKKAGLPPVPIKDENVPHSYYALNFMYEYVAVKYIYYGI